MNKEWKKGSRAWAAQQLLSGKKITPARERLLDYKYLYMEHEADDFAIMGVDQGGRTLTYNQLVLNNCDEWEVYEEPVKLELPEEIAEEQYFGFVTLDDEHVIELEPSSLTIQTINQIIKYLKHREEEDK